MHLFLFDVDGTVTETNHIVASSLAEAINEITKGSFLPEDIFKCKELTETAVATELFHTCFGGVPSPSTLAQIEQLSTSKTIARLQAARGGVSFLPGFCEFKDWMLASSDICFGFATGSYRGSTLAKLRGLNLPSHVTIATCSENYSRQEIILDAISQVSKQYRISSYDTMTYFGDGEWDLKAATACGLDFIAVAQTSEKNDFFKRLGVNKTITDYKDIEKISLMVPKIQKSA